MENSSPLPHSSNPYAQSLLQNPTNHVNQATQSKAMKNFQEFIVKLAETHPNKPLAPPAKTLLHGRLNLFVADYKTPTHLPYSAMIQRALEELNEKRGSTEECISEYLENIYDNLPLAHSVLLKHHLEKLCESGEIVVTRGQRYALAGYLKSSRNIKKKPPRGNWRTDCAKVRRNRRKQKFSKKRNQEESEDDVIKSHHGSYEKRQQLTVNRACSKDKTDQAKKLLSCVDGENGCRRDPILLLTDGKKYTKDVRSEQLEIVPCENVKAGICSMHTQGQQERDRSRLSSPERPPGFDSIGVENLPHSGSNRAWRQTRRWNRKPKAMTATSSKAEEHHEENQELLKADIVEPNEHKPQGKQLRRSLRLSSNQPCPEAIEAARMDEPQHPSNCRRLRVIMKSKPDASDIENPGVVNEIAKL